MIKLENTYKSDILKENEWLLIISEVKGFIKKYGKLKASKYIKSCWLVYDFRSPLRVGGMTLPKVQSDVATNVLKDKDFDWDKLKDISDFILDELGTPSSGMLSRYYIEICKLQTFLNKDNEYKSVTDAKEKGALLKVYQTNLNAYLDLREKVKEEEDLAVTSGYGNYEKSWLEQKAKKRK